jgi:hypothetical protein
MVTVDLDSLLGLPGAVGVGGEIGAAGPLDPQVCQRLAGDSAVTRVLVTRHPSGQQHPTHHPNGQEQHPSTDQQPVVHNPSGDQQLVGNDHGERAGLATRLRAAMARLPPALGGAPTQPLEVGRTSRVLQPAQRTALAVRDGGWVFPDCQRPWPGAKPITYGTGSTAAPPTWPTWPCCAEPTTGPCMRAAGS